MIILNSIGSNTFKLQLSDSILWTDAALGEPFTLTITNRMDNTPKVLVYPQEFASTSRTVSFQITGVSTLAQEDLSPASGQPSVYFGKAGIAHWTWTIESSEVAGVLDQGYLQVVSNDPVTQEIVEETYIGDNEDLESIVYVSQPDEQTFYLLTQNTDILNTEQPAKIQREFHYTSI
ncbi:hypothetical protein UFOVP782_28 [uncultured Caudovirales phage]|jgi:hypothetical protein|uniref:Uncharacterized protein n=1 Tax=uncultured Caudovirales phage TaxID=2100421 RepID=A0A6J5NTI5_9CAUD|nr:hypothetical protein UFOVP782_28 [uncultured Caudovirales phage]